MLLQVAYFVAPYARSKDIVTELRKWTNQGMTVTSTWSTLFFPRRKQTTASPRFLIQSTSTVHEYARCAYHLRSIHTGDSIPRLESVGSPQPQVARICKGIIVSRQQLGTYFANLVKHLASAESKGVIFWCV